MQLYEEKCQGPMKEGIKQALISGLGFGISFFLLYNVNATSFYAGGCLVRDGKTTFTSAFKVNNHSISIILFQILQLSAKI